MISVDSFGWIERLTNGPKAQAYNEIIDKNPPSEIITSTIVLYEVYKKIKQTKNEQIALEAVAAIAQTAVVPVDQNITLEAADFSLIYSMHMADAIVYATARHYDADLYTGDEDLKDIKHVILL